jgi:hypothetical protein
LYSKNRGSILHTALVIVDQIERMKKEATQTSIDYAKNKQTENKQTKNKQVENSKDLRSDFYD